MDRILVHIQIQGLMFSESHDFNNSSGLKSQTLLGWPHKIQAVVISSILGDYSDTQLTCFEFEFGFPGHLKA